MNEEKVVKIVEDISYVLMHQTPPYLRNGILYKNSYWLEGAGYDTNDDGIIANIELECKIPQGKKDLILADISESCLFREEDKLIYKEDEL